MRTKKIVAVMVLCLGLMFSITSCDVYVRGDDGYHRRYNHHEYYSSYPGRSGESYEHQNNTRNYNRSERGGSEREHKNSNREHHRRDRDSRESNEHSKDK